MSSNVRNNTREKNNNNNKPNTNNNRSRIPHSRQQQWIPRGSTNTTTVNVSSSDDNFPVPVISSRSQSHNASGNLGGRPNQRNHNHTVNRPPVNINHSSSSIDRRNKPPTSSVALLPQLVQEIQDKLLKGTIECMICYDMVRKSAPVWSCSSCFAIFHLHCIKKWANAPTSVDLSAHGSNWRCPGCQSVHVMSSKDIRYLCFCGKKYDPPSDSCLTPHSCGEVCGKPLGKDDDFCRHSCGLQCHPGPCPPCKAFATPRICPCGKKTITTRCSDQNPVLTCDEICGKPLKCLRHFCERQCHVGSCDSCQVLFDASCFCKKKDEVVVFGDLAVKGQVNVEDGIFSCSSSCENHVRKDICNPENVTSCNCGKSSLNVIATCSQTCDKTLPCRLHRCKETCHSGSCAPCRVMVTQKCQCGSTSRTVECFKTTVEVDTFTCDKLCRCNKNCGRHCCSEICCPLSISNNAATGTHTGFDPHLCSKPCEKKLRCGQHDCESLCHSGDCPTCQFPCSVPQPCGHVSSHNCHFGDCPPCSVPIPKECIGGHVVLRNIPCGSKDIRCNQICGKTRQCGMHACLRTCHPSPCDSSSSGASTSAEKSSCGQTCGAFRRNCKHTCASLCHPYHTCPDVKCEFPVTITCSCNRITATVPCDTGGNYSSFNTDTDFETPAIQKLPAPLLPVEGNKKIPLGQRKLICDDECSKTERNFEALHFGEASIVSDTIGDLFRHDPKWVMSVEERCKMLVLGRGGRGGLKVHVFSPMLKDKREAVILIVERWKLSITAAGWEPKRFIIVHVTPKSKPPSRILGSKGLNPSNLIHPPSFDPFLDMDPRLVVCLFDLPGGIDVNALVLRFGRECELVWLNDKNALAVFNDPARAATTLRRLDHRSAYYGAAVIISNTGGGGSGGGSSMPTTTTNRGGNAAGGAPTNPWKKAVLQQESSSKTFQETSSVWKVKEAPSNVESKNETTSSKRDNDVDDFEKVYDECEEKEASSMQST